MEAGILEYGLFTQRVDLVEWAGKVYDWARGVGTSFGWFPEFVGQQACETCCITDMIDLAIMLAESGSEQYWDDVERYGRNHLVESQFADMRWLQQLPAETGKADRDYFRKLDERMYCRESVAEVMRGGFSGGSAPNSIVDSRRGHWWMGCCNAHGVHGLYLLWHHAVRKTDQGVLVNLLVNRSTPWVTVDSFLPHHGKIDVTVIDAPVLYIRVPRWLDRKTVRTAGVAGNRRWRGDYLRFSRLSRGTRVSVTFSMENRAQRVRVLDDDYTVPWRGNTVTKIEPPGAQGPLYQRTHLEKAEAPLKSYEYTVPSQEIRW